MSNTDWVEANLVRQRKMLEEKQRAKRSATTTNVSAVPTAALRSDYVFADPFSTSPPMCFDGPLAFNNGDPDRFGSRSSNLSNASGGITRTVSSGKLKEKKDLVCESDEEELATRMEKADLRTVVMSDDDDLDGDGQAAVDPSKDGVEYTTLPHDDVEPDYDWITKNIDRFVEEPAKAGSVYRCLITRDKRGVDKGMYPTYYLHLDGGEHHRKIFLLAARKRKKCKTANYLISTDATDLTRDGGSFIGKVRSNAMGTQFTLYDNGKNPTKSVSVDVRQELAAVLYETNVLGFKGPRKMTILIPGVIHSGDTVSYKRLRIQPVDDKDSLIERHRRAKSQNDQNQNQVVVMQNKPPIWNDDTQSYVLNFHGRVQVASVKNFQIVHMQDPDYIVMQFGRRSDEQFAMDFRYPLSALQAFGIAMTSFHGKLACE